MRGSSLASSKQRIISRVVCGVNAFLRPGLLMVICQHIANFTTGHCACIHAVLAFDTLMQHL